MLRSDYGVGRGFPYEASDLAMIDDIFGLAPGLSLLAPDLKRGELLPIQCVSIPYRTRSHFDAQSVLETGMNRPVGSATGWINRTLKVLGGETGLGIAVGGGLPKSLQGDISVSTWAPGGRQIENESLTLQRFISKRPERSIPKLPYVERATWVCLKV